MPTSSNRGWNSTTVRSDSESIIWPKSDQDRTTQAANLVQTLAIVWMVVDNEEIRRRSRHRVGDQFFLSIYINIYTILISYARYHARVHSIWECTVLASLLVARRFASRPRLDPCQSDSNRITTKSPPDHRCDCRLASRIIVAVGSWSDFDRIVAATSRSHSQPIVVAIAVEGRRKRSG